MLLFPLKKKLMALGVLTENRFSCDVERNFMEFGVGVYTLKIAVLTCCRS